MHRITLVLSNGRRLRVYAACDTPTEGMTAPFVRALSALGLTVTDTVVEKGDFDRRHGHTWLEATKTLRGYTNWSAHVLES